MSAITLAELAAGRAADADGYVRLEVGHDTWTGLAEGCAAGLPACRADNTRRQAPWVSAIGA